MGYETGGETSPRKTKRIKCMEWRPLILDYSTSTSNNTSKASR